jgi:GNAT superfamily N-acetyltransferase
MDIPPDDIEVLRSARRMELKSKAAFCGGTYLEIGPAVISGADVVPDPHFNRISIVEPEKLDTALLTECKNNMPEGTPMFFDMPYPVSEEKRELLVEAGYHPTGESRSSMMLTERVDSPPKVEEFWTELVASETLETFLEIFLRGFDTPENIVPLARSLFHELVLRHCNPGNCRLYLGVFQGVPAATLYLYHESEEGGINMVATKKELRGRGVATAMMQRTIQDSQELGIRLLSLETQWDGAAERLYKRLGFTTIMRHEVFTNVPDLKYGL